MLRSGPGILAIALFLVACSDPAVETIPPEILCAAEALHQARQASSREVEDVLRSRADIFTNKLPVAQRQRLWTKIDQLSDRRGTQPLVVASTCEALLTPEDRRSLTASANQEASVHNEPEGNHQ